MESERAALVTALFDRAGYTALICRLPQHLVMLTGYQSVLGNLFALVTHADGGAPVVWMVVPEGEDDLLPPEIAVQVRTFAVETMESISDTLSAARAPLAAVLAAAGVGEGALVGYEGERSPVATGYTQVGFPGATTRDLLHELLPGATLRDATPDLTELAAVKTAHDLACIRRAEQVAIEGFTAARGAIRPGATEAEVAAVATAALLRAGHARVGTGRVQPYVHVLTGARAAQAYKAFNLTANTPLRAGETVLVQMEVGIEGYWAELTRTFFVETADDEWGAIYAACLRAHDAVRAMIRAGVSGRSADAAARDVLRDAGYGDDFKHGLGHGCGFQAINHDAHPILHPASLDVLRTGMVHNMEPAVYRAGRGGFRLNDNVAVREDGNELLSAALPRDLDWLTVR